MYRARLEDKLQEIGSSTSEEETIPQMNVNVEKKPKLKILY
jgi:hypothetical protein